MGRLARASVLQFVVQIGKTVAGALATIYFVRELGVDTFGFYVLTMAVVNWSTIPSVGIRSATMKRVSEVPDGSAYYSAGLVFQSGFVLVASMSLFFARGYVNEYVGLPRGPFGLDAAGSIALVLIVVSSANILLAIVRGEGRLEISSAFEGLWGLLRPGAQLVLVLLGGGVFALLGGEIVAATIIVAVTPFVVNSTLVLPTGTEFRRLYEYGRYSWVSNLKSMSYSWLDTLVLGLFVGSALIGTYEVAWRISALFTLLPASFGRMLFPTVSELSTKDRYDSVATAVGQALSFSTMLAIPGLVGSVIIGHGVLSLYGQSVSDIKVGYIVLIVLSAGRVIECIEIILMQVLNALDLPEKTFRIGIVFVATNVLLNFALIDMFGATGAATATGVSITVGTILAFRAIPDDLRIQIQWREIGTQVLSAGTMALLLLGVFQIQSPSNELLVLLYVALGGLSYFAVLTTLSKKSRQHLATLYRSSE